MEEILLIRNAKGKIVKAIGMFADTGVEVTLDEILAMAKQFAKKQPERVELVSTDEWLDQITKEAPKCVNS